MKTLQIFFILLLITLGSKAFPVAQQDTIYIQCFRELEIDKFYYNLKSEDGLVINFLFSINWEIHNFEKNNIMFSFDSRSLKNFEQGWFVKKIETKKIKLLKKKYTLEEFTKALNNEDFSVPIANGRVQLIMLYGEKCSARFEVYPVKVGTDLSNEG